MRWPAPPTGDSGWRETASASSIPLPSTPQAQGKSRGRPPGTAPSVDQAARSRPAARAPTRAIQDLEPHARCMADHLAALGDATEQREDQPAYRVDLAAFVLREHVADFLLEQPYRRAPVDVERAVDPARQRRGLGDIVLILDLAHDFLDQILDGQQPVGAAEFVD